MKAAKDRLQATDLLSISSLLSYASITVAIPIMLLKMAGDLQFSLAGAGLLEIIRSISIVLFLLIGGFIAGRFGKIYSMALGSFLISIGMLSYAFTPNYLLALGATMIFGLGSGIVEGLITPLVEENHSSNPAKFINIVHSFWPAGVILTVLVLGELISANISWRRILFVLGLISAVPGILFLLAPKHEVNRASSTQETFRALAVILKKPRFWLLGTAFLLGAGAEGGFTFWSATFIQINYDSLARAGGIGTAVFAVGMLIFRLLASLVPANKLRQLLFLSAVLGLISSSSLFFVNSLSGVYLVLFFAGGSVACFWPSLQALSAQLLAVDTTLLFILLSCLGVPGFGLMALIMGIVGDLYSLRLSFIALPIALILFMLLLGLDSLLYKNQAT